jgi:tyrosyl-tRNA synthetase
LKVGRQRPLHGQRRLLDADHHSASITTTMSGAIPARAESNPAATVPARDDRQFDPAMQPVNLLAYGKVEGMPTLSEDLAFRGLIHQMTDPELPKRLDEPGLTVYAGFDPSADSLHVGSLLQLCTLRRFQEAGHRPISLAGGGTGMIGDPGGKQSERQLLTLETIEGYLESVRPQLAQFLDLDTALLLNNADWLAELSTLEFLRDVGKHFTVNQMVAKESVKSRFDRPDQGISYTEFSYMLLQAYDFLRLHLDHGCDLQIGGSDQWGNITMGVELIRKVCGDEAYGLTTPLVLKPDGTKYGKTESGTVWLDGQRTSPFAMYQFFVNTLDEQVGQLLRFFTFLDHDAISQLDSDTATHPERRLAQKALAASVVALVHGEGEVAKCEEASAALFTEEIAGLSEDMLLAATEDAPTTDIGRAELLAGALGLVDLLVRTGLASSRGDARRTVEQGGVYVNNVKQGDLARTLGPADLLHDRYVVVRRGPRNVHLLRIT